MSPSSLNTSGRSVLTSSTVEELHLIVIASGHPLVRERSLTAIELLDDHVGSQVDGLKEARSFANVAQEVLIHGLIPCDAVISTVPFSTLAAILPDEYRTEAASSATRSWKTRGTFSDYRKTMACSLRERYCGHNIKAELDLAIYIVGQRPSVLTEDPEVTIASIINIVDSAVMWLTRVDTPVDDLRAISMSPASQVQERVREHTMEYCKGIPQVMSADENRPAIEDRTERPQ